MKWVKRAFYKINSVMHCKTNEVSKQILRPKLEKILSIKKKVFRMFYRRILNLERQHS